MTHPLPQNWQKDAFSNIQVGIVDGDRGTNYPKQSDFTQSGYCVFLNAGNVTKNGFDFSETAFISKERDELLRKGKLNKGDLVITTRGTTGNIAYFSEEIDFEHVRINSGMAIIRNKNPDIFTKYLVYYFQSSASIREIERLSFGSAQPQLTIGIINKIAPSLPPLLEQHRIVAVLETWDKAIENLERKIGLKGNIKKALAQRLLMGKTRLGGFENKWLVVRAGEVFKNVSIKNHTSEPLLSATQEFGVIPRDTLEGRVTMPTGSTSTYKLVEIGDFVISLRSFQGGIEYSIYQGLVSPAYTVLKPIKSISNNFYRLYFKSPEFISRLDAAVFGIRDGKQIGYDDFCNVLIPNPDIEEQNAIAKVLVIGEEEMSILTKKLNKLKEQKTYLLNHLIAGRIRTPENMPIPKS